MSLKSWGKKKEHPGKFSPGNQGMKANALLMAEERKGEKGALLHR